MLDNDENQPSEDVIETPVEDLFYPPKDSEPLKPTDEEVDEETSEDDEDVDAEEVDTDEDSDTEEDAEDAEEDEEESESDEEATYLELDGDEHNLNDVRDWKKSFEAGKSMQADYTRKTQALADERRTFEAQYEDYNVKNVKVGDLFLELEAMVSEDEVINWAELKEDDPEEYIKLKEKADTRKAKVTELRELKTKNAPQANVISKEEIVVESDKLFSDNPTWMKDGKLTKTFEKDTARAKKYAKDIGYSDAEFDDVVHSHHWRTLLDASKYNAQSGKKKSILEKKVKKAHLATKPKKTDKVKAKTLEEIFYNN